jgi:hypothetical protein
VSPRRKADRQQMSLLDVLDRNRRVGPELKEALVQDLKSSRWSREQVADRLTALLGREITQFIIDGWTSQTKDNYRFPAEYLAAWVQATGEYGALHLVVESCGARVVVPELVERRLVKVEAERRRLADEEKQLSALLDAARVTRRS